MFFQDSWAEHYETQNRAGGTRGRLEKNEKCITVTIEVAMEWAYYKEADESDGILTPDCYLIMEKH